MLLWHKVIGVIRRGGQGDSSPFPFPWLSATVSTLGSTHPSSPCALSAPPPSSSPATSGPPRNTLAPVASGSATTTAPAPSSSPATPPNPTGWRRHIRRPGGSTRTSNALGFFISHGYGLTETKEAEEKSRPIKIAKSSEVLELKAKLLEKEKELENLSTENKSPKKKVAEVTKNAMAAARAKEEELGAKLGSVEEELRKSRAKVERLQEKLEVAEGGRVALEVEMKRLKVQTKQWCKAAEMAAAMMVVGEGPRAEMMGKEGGRKW